MNTILGINEGINASVVLLSDGKIVFAIQEERINKIKEYVGFPHEALRFTFHHCHLSPKDVDLVCVSNVLSPVSSRDLFLAAYARNADLTHDEVVAASPSADASNQQVVDLVGRLLQDARGSGELGAGITTRGGDDQITRLVGNQDVYQHLCDHGLSQALVRRYHHHLCHAASAYFGRRKNAEEPHLVLTLDGGGDDAIAHVYRVVAGKFELLASTSQGHSVGNIYSHATHFMGMRPHEHEYKLMGMAPYADPDYALPVVEKFRSYLGLDPANPLRFKRKIPESTSAIEPRMVLDFKRTRFDSFCGGMQIFCEELMVQWVRECIRVTGIRNVVAAGGVFMNVKANKLISELSELNYFDVFPSCGDETLPFGAVWKAWSETDPNVGQGLGMQDLYLGPTASFDLDQARQTYGNKIVVRSVNDPDKTVAELISQGEIVARCTGRMEFGARALGNRSIICDPRSYGAVRRINQIIKLRDFWMPFAPAMTIEHAHDFIKIPDSTPNDVSPFMMHTFDTTARGDDITAGKHPYDDTARAQVVSVGANPNFHRLITEFGRRTGVHAVLNTSFNLHGYPVVLGTCDAVDVLLRSGLTKLLVNDVLIEKPDRT